MALPKLNAEQRADALAQATAARRRRAEVKRQLKTKQITLSEVFELADQEDALAMMKAVALLESLPRIGPLRASELLVEIGIAPSRRVRGLGPLQRAALVERFS